MMSVNQTLLCTMMSLVLLPVNANACQPQVTQAYARETPPGISTAAAYLTLHNQADKKCVLEHVSTDRAKQVMIHQNRMQGDMMRMSHLSQLEVAANSYVKLTPGGYHLMLTGLTEPLRDGEQLQLQLQFEKSQTLFVELPVIAVGGEIDSETGTIK